MIYKIVKYLLTILIALLVLIMGGCVNKINTNNVENTKPELATENVIVNTDGKTHTEQTSMPTERDTNSNLDAKTGNGKAITDRLLSEFKYYLKKVQSGDESEYNLIMGSDRAYGLTETFSLSEEEKEFVYSNYMEVKAPLKHSIVYNGYSEDGIHFTAIISPSSIENAAYKNAVNTIRDSDDEYDFLSYISDSSPYRILYVGLDVYAEDLSGKLNSIKLDGITLSNSNDETVEKPIFGEHVSEILSKYNRKLNGNYTIENKNWYTFVFDGTLIYQPVIVIDYNNQHIRLEK